MPSAQTAWESGPVFGIAAHGGLAKQQGSSRYARIWLALYPQNIYVKIVSQKCSLVYLLSINNFLIAVAAPRQKGFKKSKILK
jgi:hypothetical protein